MPITRNLVGGQWVVASSGSVDERRNPAEVAQVVARYPRMGPDDVTLAIDHAEGAFDGWRKGGDIARGRVLIDAAAALRANKEAIARDLTLENGKTWTESRAEVDAAASFFEYYGGLGRGHVGSLLADRRSQVTAWSKREPLGVVAIITPWNDPIATPARKLAPALACGNTVVLKPAEQTPMSTYHLSRSLVDAGLPPGVLNIVTGSPRPVATPLIHDDRVKAVSFTGSTQVGLHLDEELAGKPTRLQTEMGGKNAAFVLSDADLESAAEIVVGAACGQTGQRCTATSRLVVEETIADDLMALVKGRLDALTVGPGYIEGVDVGPLVGEQQLDRLLSVLDDSRRQGATVMGGERLGNDGLDRGNFMEPALVAGITEGSPAWREELFGPILCIRVVANFEEGIAAINDTRYGLSASVHTSSLRMAHRFIDEVDTGQVSVNLPTSGWDVHIPFGGFKESGSPFKEHGEEGLRFYSRVKSVALRY